MHPERRHVNVGPRKVRAIRTMSPIRISREPDTLETDTLVPSATKDGRSNLSWPGWNLIEDRSMPEH